MKKTIGIAIMLLFSATAMFAQMGMGTANRKSTHVTISRKHFTITYGRPMKRGREIFGGLVPYGQVWRTGADEATEITVDRDCVFAGKNLKAGTYVMYTIPGKEEWTVILNTELVQWGAFGYESIKDKDVLMATVHARHMKKEKEEFTIRINKRDIALEWDHTKVGIPVRFSK